MRPPWITQLERAAGESLVLVLLALVAAALAVGAVGWIVYVVVEGR
jgi:hypothetical protein